MRNLNPIKPGFVPTDNPMFPVEHGIAADPFAYSSPGTCFGPLAAALPFISAGLSVLGAVTTGIGMLQQGATASRNAQLRDQQMRSRDSERRSRISKRSRGPSPAELGRIESGNGPERRDGVRGGRRPQNNRPWDGDLRERSSP